MALSRRQRARLALYRWSALSLAAAIVIGATLPLGAVLSRGGPLADRMLSGPNCRAILRQAIPLLSFGSGNGPAPGGEGAPSGGPGTAIAGGAGSTGLVGWLFRRLTGVSPGEPASFLEAQLPFARSSYAVAIVASGRRATAPGTGPTPGGAAHGAGPGGGLSPGAWPPTSPGAGPPPATGVPDDAVVEDEDAHLYLYGGTNPVVAIVHTHGSESFLPVVTAMARAADPHADTSSLDAFSSDPSANMVRVGEELARYLSATKGVPVVQSRRLHDAHRDGFRLGAYERSLETMTEILRRHPSVKILIDLHRDAPGRETTTATINGVPTATICVIVGTDKLLDNPHWRENLSFARRLVATMEQMYPGLSRGILVRDERYNQHVMAQTLLLEVGGQENTLEEIYAAVRDLGDVLSQIVAEGFD